MGPLGLPTVTRQGRPSSGSLSLIPNSICWDQDRALFHCQQMSLSDIRGTIKGGTGSEPLFCIRAEEITPLGKWSFPRTAGSMFMHRHGPPPHHHTALSPSSKQNLHNSFQFSLCFQEGSCNWIFLQIATISAALTWNEKHTVKLHGEGVRQSCSLHCLTVVRQRILVSVHLRLYWRVAAWLPNGHSGYAKITKRTGNGPSAPTIGSIDEVQYLNLGCNDALSTALNHTI